MSTYAIVKRHLERIKKRRKLHPRIYRVPETSAFALDDGDFKRLFSLSKKNVRNLCQILHNELVPKCGSQFAIPVEIKVLCALRYYASGSLQKDVAKDETLNISQAAVSRCVVSVSQAICKKLLPYKINFPSAILYGKVKEAFNNIAGFPGVIGAVRCSHISIAAPAENDTTNPQNAYLNQKGHHSINVLLVCDANRKITHINASYPGASMDWFVWKFSKLRSILETKGSGDSWLVANAKFRPEPWLLTPFKEPNSMAERTYNLCHEGTLEVIENCIGLLKKRFGCLRSVLRVSPVVAESIIQTCAVLHNMCLDENNSDDDSIADETYESTAPTESTPFDSVDESMNAAAMKQRKRVVEIYEKL